MSHDSPFPMQWDGEALRPRAGSYWARLADDRFVVGEQYLVTEQLESSARSRSHFFATLKDHWDSFPDALLERFPSVESLRKYALIKSGFHNRESIVLGSHADAERVAAFMRPKDEFAIVLVGGCEVARYTARSQRPSVMGREEFQRSKDAVLDYANKLLGIEP